MTYNRCPETAYGDHGRVDQRGKCPYCGRKIESPWFAPDPAKSRQTRRAQDPLSIDGWDEEDYLDGRG